MTNRGGNGLNLGAIDVFTVLFIFRSPGCFYEELWGLIISNIISFCSKAGDILWPGFELNNEDSTRLHIIRR